MASLVGPVVSSAPVEAQGHVDRASDASWTLRLSMGAGQQARELSAPSCRALADAAVTLLAIQVNGETETRAPPSIADATKARPSLPIPPPSERPVAIPLRAPRSRFAVGALAGASTGAVGDPAAAVAATVIWIPGRARMELAGLWSPLRRIEYGDGISGKFELLAVGARGCWMFGEGSLALGPCAGFEGGRLSATGYGSNVADPSTQRRVWLAASTGGLLTMRASAHLALRLQVDLVLPLVRERFVVQGTESAHSPRLVGPRMLAGLEVHFP